MRALLLSLLLVACAPVAAPPTSETPAVHLSGTNGGAWTT